MTDTDTSQEKQSGAKSFMDELPVDRLKGEARNAVGALASKAASSASDKVSSATQKLTDYAENGGEGGGPSLKDSALLGGAKAKVQGDSPVMGGLKGGLSGVKDKVQNALGGGGGGKGGGGGSKVKVTNIIESIDVGVPVSVAYNAWTEFQEWSGFMKKVEHAQRQKQDEAKVDFKAQVFWSHRSWTGNILEEVPDERIVWRSKGEKGTVDGAVTFHELGPNLTRILVVLEYHPQGFFEKTGNIWRAQGRRARLELKHFRRHVMTRTILHPDDVEGWRGEIRDGDVVESHEDALEREQQEAEERESEEQESQDQSQDQEAGEAAGDQADDTSSEGDDTTAEGEDDLEGSAEDEESDEGASETDETGETEEATDRDTSADAEGTDEEGASDADTSSEEGSTEDDITDEEGSTEEGSTEEDTTSEDESGDSTQDEEENRN